MNPVSIMATGDYLDNAALDARDEAVMALEAAEEEAAGTITLDDIFDHFLTNLSGDHRAYMRCIRTFQRGDKQDWASFLGLLQDSYDAKLRQATQEILSKKD